MFSDRLLAQNFIFASASRGTMHLYQVFSSRLRIWLSLFVFIHFNSFTVENCFNLFDATFGLLSLISLNKRD